MACVSSPTSTQFATVTSSSVSTSFSSQVTTLADSTATAVITSCLQSASASGAGNGGQCASSTLITSTSVVQGEVSTAQVPFEVTIFFTSTEATKTLFASCTTDTTSTISTTTTTTTTPNSFTTSTTQQQQTTSSTTTAAAADTTSSSSSDTTTLFTQSLTTSVTTPIQTFTTSLDTTLANGQVTQTAQTVTSTLPASSIVLTTLVPQASTQTDSNGGSSSNLGPIIGGTLGGFFALIAIVAGIWYYCRRRPSWDDIFEKGYDEYAGANAVKNVRRDNMLDMEDEPIHVNPGEANTEPKPYVYGLVGSTNALSPPSLNAGVPTIAPARPLGGHSRSPSQTPLILNNGVSSAPSSRPNSFGAGSSSTGHSASPGPGLSHSPVSAVGGRSGSPGPLDVSINSGPSLSVSCPVDADSPTSVAPPRGALFVANQDPMSEPISPGSPAIPGSAGRKEDSMSNVASPSLAGSMVGASRSAYPNEKLRLQHQDSVSSHSVYSQASVGTLHTQRRTSGGVVVHTDAGRALPPGQPPAYQG